MKMKRKTVILYTKDPVPTEVTVKLVFDSHALQINFISIFHILEANLLFTPTHIYVYMLYMHVMYIIQNKKNEIE